jgi:NTE family protein
MRHCSIILAVSFIALTVIGDAQSPIGQKIIIKPEFSPQEMNWSANDNNTEPGIGLALSGGGARGLALIGVLKVFEKEQIKINFISAVSMGGIIGGLYSCGYSPEEIENIALDLKWSELLSPMPLRSTLLTSQKGQSEKSLIKIRFEGLKPVVPRAITSGQNLSLLLENLTARGGVRPSISFDYLNPPLRIVCTDLTSGEKVVVSSGSLGEALRATMAVPVAFTPVEINGRLLVDGGLVDPIPVDITREVMGYPVVAVNTTSDLLPVNKIDNVIDIADQTTTIMSMDKKRQDRKSVV